MAVPSVYDKSTEVLFESESGNIDKRSRLLENPFFSSDQEMDDNSALQVPIISENESRFVVIVEFIEREKRCWPWVV